VELSKKDKTMSKNLTSSHTLNYILKNKTGDFAIDLETYVEYCFFGEKSVEDLDAETLQYVAQEFEEALEQLRGDE
jgi:hypothetical protein